MRFQKGQAIVEFALLLPLFLILLFGILYTGMIMADYLTLSSMARSSAREAAVISTEKYKQSKYSTVISNYSNKELPVDIFTWDPTKDKYFKITYEKNSRNVKVEIKADLNKKKVGYKVASVMDSIAGSNMKNMELNVTYTMFSEHELE
ncbi:TadE/TadG family type IV pilus assembly protein [Selenomonas ruminantium]|uniref:TadE-like protein n=1 Tax=Selenomonas ruminantium TaxID=971 RepID=A0A1H0MDU9_SELRU|nr:TadE/TadG family type IV pilus assembly protein [Selenomonas ruminantium]SDO78537.1 TadE-like protein [Selenomonas ruminantium]